MESSWYIPFVIIVIILFLFRNEENAEIITEAESNGLLESFFDSLLLIGLCPLLYTSLIISMSYASGLVNTAGTMQPYCRINKI